MVHICPTCGARWTGATLLGQLAARVAPQQVAQLGLPDAAAGGRGPPPLDGAAVRGMLRCVLPPPLSKVRGALKPSSAVVQGE